MTQEIKEQDNIHTHSAKFAKIVDGMSDIEKMLICCAAFRYIADGHYLPSKSKSTVEMMDKFVKNVRALDEN